MFGLDARIALVLFGAMSIISGAALYSAIQEAIGARAIEELQQVEKALEEYYLDTGALPEKVYSLELDASKLVSDSSSNWKGPYLTNFKNNSTYLIYKSGNDSFNHGSLHLLTLNSNIAFGGTDAISFNSSACSTTDINNGNCDIWIYRNNLKDDNLAKIIDKRLDHSDGANSGKFRWEYISSEPNLKYRYMYQTQIPYK